VRWARWLCAVACSAAPLTAATAGEGPVNPLPPLNFGSYVLPAQVPLGERATLTVEASFLAGCAYAVDNGPYLPAASSVLLPALPLGPHSVTVNCFDGAQSGTHRLTLIVVAAGGGPTFQIFQGAGNSVFDKPVIVVEGIDPDNETSSEDVFNLIPPGLRSAMFADGRDLVVVNFPNGGAAVETNSAVVIDVIERVNQLKQGTHPNAVLGASMGGVVARHALRTMENQGSDHQTSLYVSLDGPHRGANVPFDILSRLNSIIDRLKSSVFGIGTGDLKEVRGRLTAPAARQLLVWDSRSDAFFRSLDALGYPDRPARVAFANGRGDGVGQGLANGQVLLSYKITFGGYTDLHHKIVARRIPLDRCSYPCDPTLDTFYDNAPGGIADTVGLYYRELLEAEDDHTGVNVVIRSYPGGAPHSFVPTLSALDIRNELLGAPVTEELARRSPFDEVHVASGNTPHISFPASARTSQCDDPRIPQADSFSQHMLCALARYHRPGLVLPSRAQKLPPLRDIPGTLSVVSLLSRGDNVLSWNAMPGATHYEVLGDFAGYTARIASLPAGTTSYLLTIGETASLQQRVFVRGCVGDRCSYPVSGVAAYFPDTEGQRP
jgi:hypothetical protein